ncbi:DnaJ domain-containing protein [Spinellus fusiger]|nr:DnaJ domain-containing protein [Spinellus fusiger]
MQSNLSQCKERDFYEILGCVHSSTPEQIRAEYRQLALLYHPDKSSGQPHSHDNQKRYDAIKAAYDIVGNPVQRAVYDRWQRSGLAISFSDFAHLNQHGQVVHWQNMPSRPAISLGQEEEALADNNNKKIPWTGSSSFTTVHKMSFWTNNSLHTKFREYRI